MPKPIRKNTMLQPLNPNKEHHMEQRRETPEDNQLEESFVLWLDQEK